MQEVNPQIEQHLEEPKQVENLNVLGEIKKGQKPQYYNQHHYHLGHHYQFGHHFQQLPQQQQQQPKTEEEIINDLIKYLEDLFALDNFRKNKYLMNRANPYFEILIRDIENENGIKGITNNKNLIHQALCKISSISVLNNGYVKLKNIQPRNKIVIKDINLDDEAKIKILLEEYDQKDKILNIAYDPKLKYMTIMLNDEQSATDMLNHLVSQEINRRILDCSFSEENMFITMKNDLVIKPRYPHYQPYQSFQNHGFPMGFNPQMFAYPNLMHYSHQQQQPMFYQKPYQRFQKPNYQKMNQNPGQNLYQALPIPTIGDNPLQVQQTQEQQPQQKAEIVSNTQNEQNLKTEGLDLQKQTNPQITNQSGGFQRNYNGRQKNHYNRGPRYHNYPGGGYNTQTQQISNKYMGNYQHPGQYHGQYQGQYQSHHQNQGDYSGMNRYPKSKYHNDDDFNSKNDSTNAKSHQNEEIAMDEQNFPPLNN